MGGGSPGGERCVPFGMLSTQALAPLTVLDLDGRAVPVGSFWADGPVLLVYIRHYG